MSVVLTDRGIAHDATPFAPLDEWTGAGGVDLPNSVDAAEVFARVRAAEAVRIAFPSFADGRGFTLARRLRQLGFAGRLRAAGHVLPDQYRHLRRAGFDDIAFDDAAAAARFSAAVPDAVSESYRQRLGFTTGVPVPPRP
ncbi:protein of unknown function [Rhodovulum sp. ES.010]|uniref:DUF934 domain-containing protein n=1 Tax=Rhodovulum sp. ES.010 TaxID=1882821 RepID=UPI000928BF97|nr:DUF934 domain-containing protein [Rhodovulum sp. ES.010]SIO38495.1 protein of unknown function [Rhodovulum sp. ES.010]